MSALEHGEVRVDVIQELRTLADRGVDVSELASILVRRLNIMPDNVLVPIVYFRAAFGLTLREALPLRELLTGGDRSEIEEILIPAMKRTKGDWQPQELERV